MILMRVSDMRKPSDRKENEQSLAEKLLKAYELSNKSLDFSETKSQIQATEWVQRIMKQLQENERRMKSNG